jgi:acyl-CoA reductase-like NAD-dependent aldehyde dehydrogenase
VHQAVYDEFIAKFAEGAKAYKLGDPTKEDTNLGPVVSVASAKRIRKQVKDAGKSFSKGVSWHAAIGTDGFVIGNNRQQ